MPSCLNSVFSNSQSRDAAAPPSRCASRKAAAAMRHAGRELARPHHRSSFDRRVASHLGRRCFFLELRGAAPPRRSAGASGEPARASSDGPTLPCTTLSFGPTVLLPGRSNVSSGLPSVQSGGATAVAPVPLLRRRQLDPRQVVLRPSLRPRGPLSLADVRAGRG